MSIERPILSRYARGLIHRKVRQLIAGGKHSPQDYRDLEHDYVVRLLKALPSFDSRRSHINQFVTVVVERHTATILERKAAPKRNRRVRSLSEALRVDDHRPAHLADEISDSELHRRQRIRLRATDELVRLKCDVKEVLDSLPKLLRELAIGLQSKPLAEVARDMGYPRTTVCYWVRELRKRFERAGLKGYLED